MEVMFDGVDGLGIAGTQAPVVHSRPALVKRDATVLTLGPMEPDGGPATNVVEERGAVVAAMPTVRVGDADEPDKREQRAVEGSARLPLVKNEDNVRHASDERW